MTIFEEVAARLPPGGRVWPEELVIRLGPGETAGVPCVVRGAHVAIGYDAPGIAGTRAGGRVEAVPCAAAATDATFAAAVAIINTAALDNLAAAQAEVARLTAENAALRAAAGAPP